MRAVCGPDAKARSPRHKCRKGRSARPQALKRAVRSGASAPEAYAFPNSRGGRLSRQRVAEIVRDAAEEASERLSARGLPPLPRTTPHTLRRTYISIALLANRFDVLWVMGQVGHADSKMTMDVYAHLQQRVKREHGTAFDRLVDQAREQLYGIEPPAPSDAEAGGLSGVTIRYADLLAWLTAEIIQPRSVAAAAKPELHVDVRSKIAPVETGNLELLSAARSARPAHVRGSAAPRASGGASSGRR